VIDETGILGRRYEKDSADAFLPEQIRVINNVILFTDDGWKTIKTALGKIVYNDPDSETGESEAYGLLAEVLVGSLIMGNTLKIRNVGSSVTIDENGITIMNGDNKVFQASDNGTLFISPNAQYLDNEGKTTTLSALISAAEGKVLTEVSTTYITSNGVEEKISASQVLEIITKGADGKPLDKPYAKLSSKADWIDFQAGQITIDSKNFKLTADGTITATAGTIAGLDIQPILGDDGTNIVGTRLTSDNFSLETYGKKGIAGAGDYYTRIGVDEITGTKLGNPAANGISQYQTGLQFDSGSVAQQFTITLTIGGIAQTQYIFADVSGITTLSQNYTLDVEYTAYGDSNTWYTQPLRLITGVDYSQTRGLIITDPPRSVTQVRFVKNGSTSIAVALGGNPDIAVQGNLIPNNKGGWADTGVGTNANPWSTVYSKQIYIGDGRYGAGVYYSKDRDSNSNPTADTVYERLTLQNISFGGTTYRLMGVFS
jgi:hypothetical protein